MSNAGPDIGRYQQMLEARKAELLVLSEGARSARAPVELDQQAIGRLSRQDALQQQAMANAQEARRGMEKRKIEMAMKRINEGEYGYCDECGEEIAAKRLDIDLTAVRCADCAR